MALLGAHRLRTIDQATRQNADSTSRLVIEQPQPLRAARRSEDTGTAPTSRRTYGTDEP